MNPGSDGPTDSPKAGSDETTPRPAPSNGGSTTLASGGQTSPASTAPAPSVEPLSDFEEALAGTWRRYHVKNKGYSSEYSYYEYLDFEENRTACRWKYGEESSTSSTDTVFDDSDYSNWRISEQLSGGGERYKVLVQGAGLDYVFDFAENLVYPAG